MCGVAKRSREPLPIQNSLNPLKNEDIFGPKQENHHMKKCWFPKKGLFLSIVVFLLWQTEKLSLELDAM